MTANVHEHMKRHAVLKHGAGSDGCATAAGPRDLRLKHDGRSLPAPFLPVKVGSVDFPIEKGVTMFLLF